MFLVCHMTCIFRQYSWAIRPNLKSFSIRRNQKSKTFNQIHNSMFTSNQMSDNKVESRIQDLENVFILSKPPPQCFLWSKNSFTPPLILHMVVFQSSLCLMTYSNFSKYFTKSPSLVRLVLLVFRPVVRFAVCFIIRCYLFPIWSKHMRISIPCVSDEAVRPERSLLDRISQNI